MLVRERREGGTGRKLSWKRPGRSKQNDEKQGGNKRESRRDKGWSQKPRKEKRRRTADRNGENKKKGRGGNKSR